MNRFEVQLLRGKDLSATADSEDFQFYFRVTPTEKKAKPGQESHSKIVSISVSISGTLAATWGFGGGVDSDLVALRKIAYQLVLDEGVAKGKTDLRFTAYSMKRCPYNPDLIAFDNEGQNDPIELEIAGEKIGFRDASTTES